MTKFLSLARLLLYLGMSLKKTCSRRETESGIKKQKGSADRYDRWKTRN
ncbi:MAG: hypothetical protein UZ16_OP3001003520 [Candidatus Hinthialibacteria bacterium OLB16]|nr:MAG: hypothetical protein UZ16_OP3001003520 [Candidatus Hinthialibacteria bacterium OLB16]